MDNQFIISGFSDEIDPMIEKQFKHLNMLGISYFEPRGIDGKNIADLDDAEVASLKERMDRYGIKVSSIGSPIGKIGINDPFETHLEKLKRVIKIAKAMGTTYIRVFSFFIPKGDSAEDYRDEVMSRMKKMVELAEKENVILLHENEKEIYGDVAERCLDILKTINSPNLKAVFDPANFIQCGQKVYPDAFELLKPYIEYMHIKDAVENGGVVPAGYGIGSVKKIISDLKNMGYRFGSLDEIPK